jgi:8-oxo-dGTP diphosphatase
MPLSDLLHALAQRGIGRAQRALTALTRGSLPPFCCVAALVERDGALLLLDRADGQGLCLPGGYVNMGEEPDQAMAREVLEETGLEVSVTALLTALPDASSHIKSINLVYACEVQGGALRASHEGRPCWVDPASCPERLLPVSRLTLERLGRL